MRNFYLDPIQTLQHDPLFIDMIDPTDFDIPIVINDDVKRWMNYLLGPGQNIMPNGCLEAPFTPDDAEETSCRGIASV